MTSHLVTEVEDNRYLVILQLTVDMKDITRYVTNVEMPNFKTGGFGSIYRAEFVAADNKLSKARCVVM